MTNLWMGYGLGSPERDDEVVVQLSHMEAHFGALDERVVTAPSLSSCILFAILTLLSEQCFARIETIFLMHTTFIHTFKFRVKEKKQV